LIDFYHEAQDDSSAIDPEPDLHMQIKDLNARLTLALQERDEIAEERDKWHRDFLAADAERTQALEKLQVLKDRAASAATYIKLSLPYIT
jgi:uncharacterized coiled-coil DUF342 family protein